MAQRRAAKEGCGRSAEAGFGEEQAEASFRTPESAPGGSSA